MLCEESIGSTRHLVLFLLGPAGEPIRGTLWFQIRFHSNFTKHLPHSVEGSTLWKAVPGSSCLLSRPAYLALTVLTAEKHTNLVCCFSVFKALCCRTCESGVGNCLMNTWCERDLDCVMREYWGNNKFCFLVTGSLSLHPLSSSFPVALLAPNVSLESCEQLTSALAVINSLLISSLGFCLDCERKPCCWHAEH